MNSWVAKNNLSGTNGKKQLLHLSGRDCPWIKYEPKVIREFSVEIKLQGCCRYTSLTNQPQQRHCGPFRASSPARVNAASADSALPCKYTFKSYATSFRERHLSCFIFECLKMFNISNTSQRSAAVAEGKTTSTDETAVVSNVKALFEIFLDWFSQRTKTKQKSFGSFISGRRIFFLFSFSKEKQFLLQLKSEM